MTKYLLICQYQKKRFGVIRELNFIRQLVHKKLCLGFILDDNQILVHNLTFILNQRIEYCGHRQKSCDKFLVIVYNVNPVIYCAISISISFSKGWKKAGTNISHDILRVGYYYCWFQLDFDVWYHMTIFYFSIHRTTIKLIMINFFIPFC